MKRAWHSLTENKSMKKRSIIYPELLSPAGNFEKLSAALSYGADAVFLSGQKFGMRAASDNFNMNELKLGIKYAHDRKKKVYVTVNTMPRQHEMYELEKYLEELSDSSPDAFIIADLGVFRLCKKYLPTTSIHISTQAATVNAEACKMWYDLGASRAVLAREVSLKEITTIRNSIPDDFELEAFVHGSMCVSFSGRCMLSQYYTGRDANRGECTQPCRWEYEFCEIKRPNDHLYAEIQPEGTYIFGSKDLCMIEHIADLINAGINSFKIEGRMKSSYYAAVCTNAYRIAIERYYNDSKADVSDLKRELNLVSHREYCTGYFFDPNMTENNLASDTGYIAEQSYYCRVEEVEENGYLSLCRQKNKFNNHELVEYISPGKIGEDIHILDMLDMNLNSIESCPHPQMMFYIRTDKPLRVGDIIRSKS